MTCMNCGGTHERDCLVDAALEAVRQRGRASAVVLQRALGIGYQRAIKILDTLTAEGHLGPDTPAGAREIIGTPKPSIVPFEDVAPYKEPK